MARLKCRKTAQPDFQFRDEAVLKFPGETNCRFLCGEQSIGTAEVWKDEGAMFQKWRIRVTFGGQEKIIKGASPKRVYGFLEQLANRFDCSRFRG